MKKRGSFQHLIGAQYIVIQKHGDEHGSLGEAWLYVDLFGIQQGRSTLSLADTQIKGQGHRGGIDQFPAVGAVLTEIKGFDFAISS